MENCWFALVLVRKVGNEGQWVVDVCSVKVEDLVKFLFVLSVGGLASYSPFVTNGVCQTLGVCCHRDSPMANEVLKLSNTSGKQGGFVGMSGQVFGEVNEVAVEIGVERDGRVVKHLNDPILFRSDAESYIIGGAEVDALHGRKPGVILCE